MNLRIRTVIKKLIDSTRHGTKNKEASSTVPDPVKSNQWPEGQRWKGTAPKCRSQSAAAATLKRRQLTFINRQLKKNR